MPIIRGSIKLPERQSYLSNEVQQHLQYVTETGYLQSRTANSESADNAPLAVCNNAQLTQSGEKVLRTKFFKV